jgi:hypothetical protein
VNFANGLTCCESENKRVILHFELLSNCQESHVIASNHYFWSLSLPLTYAGQIAHGGTIMTAGKSLMREEGAAVRNADVKDDRP